MDELNEKINNLIKYLCDEDKKIGKFKTTKGLESRTVIKTKIREILGIDEQCSQCLQFKFKYDLSLIEGTKEKICQDCAEKIIKGDLKVRED